MGGNHQPVIFSRFMTCFFEALDRLVEKMRPAPLVWQPRIPPSDLGYGNPPKIEAGGPKIVASSEMVETYWFVFKEKVSTNSCLCGIGSLGEAQWKSLTSRQMGGFQGLL